MIKWKKHLSLGANKSIGFETARRLLQEGYYVYLGSRTLENGQKAVEILREGGLTNVEAVQIDVTSAGFVEDARAEIGKKRMYWTLWLITPALAEACHKVQLAQV